jgi:hypothetical protein
MDRYVANYSIGAYDAEQAAKRKLDAKKMKEFYYIKYEDRASCICIQQKEENKETDLSHTGHILPVKK